MLFCMIYLTDKRQNANILCSSKDIVYIAFFRGRDTFYTQG